LPLSSLRLCANELPDLKAGLHPTKVVQRITAPKDSISVEHSGVFLFGLKPSSCICSLAWKNLFAVPAKRIIAC
jgi:hypothetical protein